MVEIDETIELSEYQVAWPCVFAEEQGRICEALEIPSEDLEHTGSTAVPDLVAKPIVDLMLGVRQFPPDGEFLKRIELLGWEALAADDILPAHTPESDRQHKPLPRYRLSL